jgi:PAS domain S-box-containing protein
MEQAPDSPDAIKTLIALLDHDDRPTFILDNHYDGPQPEKNYFCTYRNIALERFLSDRRGELSIVTLLDQWGDYFEQLEKRHIHQPFIDWEIDGIAWRTTTLDTRWKVTHCRQILGDVPAATYVSGYPSYHPTPIGDRFLPTPPTAATPETSTQFHSRVYESKDEEPRGQKRKRTHSCSSVDRRRSSQEDVGASDVPLPAAKSLKERAEEAELTGKMFRELAEYAAVGCAMYHPDGRPIFLNEAYLRLTGMTKDGFRPGVWQQAIVPEDLPIVEERWGQLAAGISVEPFAFRVKRSSKADMRKDGSETMEYRWLLSNGRCKLNPDGTCRTVMGWLTDISYQKWSQHLQTKRLEDALENKRQTEKFIDMVSCFDFILEQRLSVS